MASLLERLEQRIAAERAEIVRIRTDAVINERSASERMATLQAAADTLKARPELEALLERLGALGITVEG
jgi:hypothetical protein